MKTKVNKIHNADFSEGKAGPRNWVWSATTKRARWRRTRTDQPPGDAGMTILMERTERTAFWSQVVVCKPGRHYRIEATASCDLATSSDPADDARGFVLAVQPLADDHPVGQQRVTPGVVRSSAPIAVRTYYEAPGDIRRLKLSVGVVDACGTACIHHVRFIEILDPDTIAHLLAIPAPPYAVHPPRVATSVSVCSAGALTRPITALLAACLGESKVSALAPRGFRAHQLEADAVLLPDATPPASIRSLSGLMKLAAKRIVVISLPAFAKLTRGTLSVRRVEQDDDPIHAKVTYANHATKGFALDDTFPYAWMGKNVGSFVQNQFRRTGALKAFCQDHGFVTLLASMCDQDVTSDRAICLYKDTPGGGLFVLDIEPAEAAPSTFGEPTLAMHLLLSLLGRTETSLGQFVSADWKESEFRGSLREMPVLFKPLVVHEADLPIEEVTEQLVTIGREDEAYGLPLVPKPVILVRSGLTSGDLESVYGAFVWFKQFVRMEPYRCPYAHQLASQFRLAWIPCLAPWESREGWRRSDRAACAPMTIETDGNTVATLIDIVSRPINRARVVFPKDDAFSHYATWLPRLTAAFPPGSPFAPRVGDDGSFFDRDRFSWARAPYHVQLAVVPEAFETGAPRDVLVAGGQAIRIEIPAHDADFTAYSIESTDLAATLLEHVIGLQYGLIAVNRQPAAAHFDALPPVAPGEAVIIDRRDPVLRENASQVG